MLKYTLIISQSTRVRNTQNEKLRKKISDFNALRVLRCQTSEISSGCFASCSNLESIILPESLTSIAADAFQGCTNVVAHVDDSSYAKEYCELNSISFVVNEVEE